MQQFLGGDMCVTVCSQLKHITASTASLVQDYRVD